MRYDYKKGVIEKDKNGHKKLWLGFFGIFIIALYSGVLATTLFLNGWPFDSFDETAKVVKATKPSKDSDKLYIPVLNLENKLEGSLKISGKPGRGEAKIDGSEFGLGITPGSLRNASPFFNLSKLKDGDEIFVDKNGVRYAYKVKSKIKDNDQLILKTKSVKITAEPIGTVAWQDGKAQLNSF
jgi:hypothetical protein